MNAPKWKELPDLEYRRSCDFSDDIDDMITQSFELTSVILPTVPSVVGRIEYYMACGVPRDNVVEDLNKIVGKERLLGKL